MKNIKTKTSYACFIDGSNLIIQPQGYIEDGWFIKVVDGVYEVYEIPQYGGRPHHLADFECAETAIEYALNLT